MADVGVERNGADAREACVVQGYTIASCSEAKDLDRDFRSSARRHLMTPRALGMRLEYRPHGEGDAGGATLRRQPSASMLPVRTRYFQPRRARMKGTSDRWLEPPFFSPASWAPAGPCLAEPRGLAAKRADCSDGLRTTFFRSTVPVSEGAQVLTGQFTRIHREGERSRDRLVARRSPRTRSRALQSEHP